MLFPYDYEAAKVWDKDFIVSRIVLNVVVTDVYVGFWYLVLYHGDLNLATRKFNDKKRPNAGRLMHNIWYTTLGAAQVHVHI